jgi:prevent-host-death family protein
MEESITAAEARRSFSRILCRVKNGRSYLVTLRGTPIARITPAGPDEAAAAAAKEALLARLEAQPIQVVGHSWRKDELYEDRSVHRPR